MFRWLVDVNPNILLDKGRGLLNELVTWIALSKLLSDRFDQLTTDESVQISVTLHKQIQKFFTVDMQNYKIFDVCSDVNRHVSLSFPKRSVTL